MTTAHSAPLDPQLSGLVEQVRAASAARTPLHIVGGGSKRFLARADHGVALSLAAHRGIVSYEPSEMVITAKAGTSLVEVEQALSEHGQLLGFEPPRLGAASTIGGVVAAGLSGPARPYRGSVRDFVLGVEIINGHGQVLRFGGEVMKNVAGYDISRLVVGAFGALGVISTVSLRSLPAPATQATLVWPLEPDAAHRRMLELVREPWPITALAALGGTLRMRVSGSSEALRDAERRLAPAEVLADDETWAELRDVSAAALQCTGEQSLWRLSLPPAAPDPLESVAVYDWGGAQRWLFSATQDDSARAFCRAHGGHASCVRRAATETAAVFSAPETAQQKLMQRIKLAFDPAGIFNPNCYFEWM